MQDGRGSLTGVARAIVGGSLALLLSCHTLPPKIAPASPSILEWSGVIVPPAPPDSTGLVELGERLYGWNCFPCHGAEGLEASPPPKRP